MSDSSGIILKLTLLLIIIGTIMYLFKTIGVNVIPLVKTTSKLGPLMLIVSIIMIGLIVYFGIIGFDLTQIEDKYVEKIVDVEGFDGLNLETGFCKSHEGNRNELNKSCGELTKNSCVSTDCCVYAKMQGEEKCYSGDAHGPTFRRNSDGKTYDIDYYFFKDKCFGSGC